MFAQFHLLLLACALLSPSALAEDILLVNFSPFSGAWDGGLSMEPAFEMAFEDVNAHATLLPGHRLVRQVEDEKCDAGEGMKALIQVLATKPGQVAGILGPGCSDVAKPLSSTAGLFHLVTISGSTGSADLSNTRLYPHFLRTWPADSAYTPAMVALCKKFDWLRITTITERDNTNMLTMERFEQGAAAAGISVVTARKVYTDRIHSGTSSTMTDVVAQDIIGSLVRIVVIHGFAPLLRSAFCAAFRLGAIGPQYVWMINGWVADEWWKPVASDDHGCSQHEMQQAVEGSLSVTLTSSVADGAGTLPTGETPSAFRARYADRAARGGVATSSFGPTAYDSVWVFAHAFHKLVVEQGRSVASLQANAVGLQATFNEIMATDFFGASGRVRFDANGDREGLASIFRNQRCGAYVEATQWSNGVFSPASPDVAFYRQIGSATSTSAAAAAAAAAAETPGIVDCNVTQTQRAPPSDGREVFLMPPRVVAVEPSIGHPEGGDMILISGSGFHGTLVVTIGGSLCSNAVVMTSQKITCITPAGSGADTAVVVTVISSRLDQELVSNSPRNDASLSSEPQYLWSYFRPLVVSISRTWARDQIFVSVTGAYFIEDAVILCRVGEEGRVSDPATFVSSTEIRCRLKVSVEARLGWNSFFVSNDGGQKWSSGLALQRPLYSGSIPGQQQVVPEVVVGVFFPVDKWWADFFQQTLDAVAAEVHSSNIFRGTTLKFEKLLTQADASVALDASSRLIQTFSSTMIGLIGPYYSHIAIPLVSNMTALRLPLVSYDAWTNEVANATAFPYFLRTSPSNRNWANAWLAFYGSLGWSRIAILSGTAAAVTEVGRLLQESAAVNVALRAEVLEFASDENGAHTVLPVTAIRDAARPFAQKIAAAGIRIIQLQMLHEEGMEGVLLALNESGLLAPGHAVLAANRQQVDGERQLVRSQMTQGLLIMDVPQGECRAKWCPLNPTAWHAGLSTRIYDAALALAIAVGPALRGMDGGADFFNPTSPNHVARREEVMTTLRSLDLPSSMAASGRLNFETGTNDRSQSTLQFLMSNVAGPGQLVDVGRVEPVAGFVPLPDVAIAWPGYSATRPFDYDASAAPAGLTVLWVAPPNPGDIGNVFYQWAEHAERHIVAAVDEINRDKLLLSNTQLSVRRVDWESCSEMNVQNCQSSGAYINATRLGVVEAKQRGEPVVALLTYSSFFSTIVMESDLEELKELPLAGFDASADYLSDPARFKSFVRTNPHTGLIAAGVCKLAESFHWDPKRILVIYDMEDSWTTSISTGIERCSAQTNSGGGSQQKGGGATPLGLTFGNLRLARQRILQELTRQEPILIVMNLYATRQIEFLAQVLFESGKLNQRYQIFDVNRFVTNEISARNFSPANSSLVNSTALRAMAHNAIAVAFPGMESSSKGAKRSRQAFSRLFPNSSDAFMADVPIWLPYLVDNVRLIATAADSCLAKAADPLNRAEFMAELRNTTIEGTTGTIQFAPGSNERQFSLASLVRSRFASAGTTGRNSANASSQVLPSTYEVTHISRLSSERIAVEVCPGSSLGDGCASTAVPPTLQSCYASSPTTIRVEWDPGQGGTPREHLSGYQVTVSDGRALIALTISGTSIELQLGNALGILIEKNRVYSITVKARYYGEGGTAIESTSVFCEPQHGLPCIPDTAPGVERVCGCRSDEFHSAGLPGMDSRQWRCESCLPGLECTGGTVLGGLSTSKGYFVSGNTSKESKFGRPSLFQCPGGAQACRGSQPIRPILVRESEVTVQCSNGHTGMACQACQEGWVGSNGNCRRCTISQQDAVGALLASLIALVVVAVILAAVVRTLGRPPKFERAFFKRYAELEAQIGFGAASRIYDEYFCRETDGVSPGGFTLVNAARFEQGLQRMNVRGLGKAGVQMLWAKLDADQSGDVSEEEFTSFVYGLRKGTNSTSIWRRVLSRLWRWKHSTRVSTDITLLISAAQILSSMPKTFPFLLSQSSPTASRSTSGDTSPSNRTDLNLTSGAAGSTRQQSRVGAVLQVFTDVGDAASNINVFVVDFFACSLGPRHMDKLLVVTLVMLSALLLAKVVYQAVKAVSKSTARWLPRRLRKMAFRQRTKIRRISTQAFLRLIFLTYPLVSAVCLQSFVCDQYKLPNGEKRWWLRADATVECDPTRGPYRAMFAYAFAASILVIIGWPLALLRTVSTWHFPVPRIFEAGEDGKLQVAKKARLILGSAATTFKPFWWAGSALEMVFKLALTSLIGVLFHAEPITGAVVAAAVCIIVVATYGVASPFRYPGGNHLAALVYGSAGVVYCSMVAGQAAYETAALVAWILLFSVTMLDLCQFDAENTGLLQNYIQRFNDAAHRIVVRRGRPIAHNCRSKHLPGIGRTAALVRARAERMTFVASLFTSLADMIDGLVQQRTRKKKAKVKVAESALLEQHAKEFKAAAASFLRPFQQQETQQQHHPHHHQKWPGRETDGAMSAELTWPPLLAMESAATELSKIICPDDDLEAASSHHHHRRQRRHERIRPGHIHLAFSAAPELRKNSIVSVLRALKHPANPSMADIQVAHKLFVALVRHGADFGHLNLLGGLRDEPLAERKRQLLRSSSFAATAAMQLQVNVMTVAAKNGTESRDAILRDTTKESDRFAGETAAYQDGGDDIDDDPLSQVRDLHDELQRLARKREQQKLAIHTTPAGAVGVGNGGLLGRGTLRARRTRGVGGAEKKGE